MVDFRKAAQISLDKAKKEGKQLTDKRACYWVYDASGSMGAYLSNGSIANLGDRILSMIAEAQWDDDNTIPTWAFGYHVKGPIDIKLGNHTGEIAKMVSKWGTLGSTNMSDAIKEVVKYHRSSGKKGMFRKSTESNPFRPLLFLQTDGNPDDWASTEIEFTSFPGDIIVLVFGASVGFMDTVRNLDFVKVINMGYDPMSYPPERLYDEMLDKLN